MNERTARIAAIALLAILTVAFILLMALFGALNAPGALPTPTTVALAPTATPIPASPTPEPSATPSLTLEPLPTPTVSCPIPATPEPLWVDPVVSPTNQLSQDISVTLGHGVEISVASEAGTVRLAGTFTLAQPVTLNVPLAPNTTNNLVVTGKVEYAPGCSYTLQTRTDRLGGPLVIVQQSGTPPPVITTAAPPGITPLVTVGIVTPPPPGSIFVKPFSQVFALGQATPDTTGQLWLYEAGTDAPFQVQSQQGAFTRLLSRERGLDFWTLSDNIVPAPAPPPKYDASVAGQTVQFVPDTTVFACEGNYPQPLILGACQQFQNASQAQVVQRATVDSSVLYLVQLDGKMYWVSANTLKTAPP